jgi:rare lipoprotein A
MTKPIATAIIAASALLAATSHGAFARTPSHTVRPAHVSKAAHGVRVAHAVRTIHAVRTTHTVRTHVVRTAHVVRPAAVLAPVVQTVGAGDAVAWVGESGTASYYGPTYNGRRSASGARFDQMALTAAHPWLPFGTKVKVVLAGTDRSVIVTITDRLYSNRRVVDLSVAAARELGIIRRGVAQVSLQPV